MPCPYQNNIVGTRHCRLLISANNNSEYQLVDREYELTQFRGDDRIESGAFPELNLSAQQVFEAGIVNE